jgi:hypothetical protein
MIVLGGHTGVKPTAETEAGRRIAMLADECMLIKHRLACLPFFASFAPVM